MPSIPLSTFHGRTATTTADESSSTSSSSSSFKSKASSFFSSTNPTTTTTTMLNRSTSRREQSPNGKVIDSDPRPRASTDQPRPSRLNLMTSSHKKKIGLAPLSAGASYASIPVLLHSHDREKDRPRTPDTLPFSSIQPSEPYTPSHLSRPSSPNSFLGNATLSSFAATIASVVPPPTPPSSSPPTAPTTTTTTTAPQVSYTTQPPQPTPTLRRNPSSAATLPSVLGPQLNKTRAMELQMDQDMELKRREIAVMAEKEARYADVVLGWLPPSSTVDASGKPIGWERMAVPIPTFHFAVEQGRRERGEVGEEEGMVVLRHGVLGGVAGKMKLELTC